jgi:hypothetical protein
VPWISENSLHSGSDIIPVGAGLKVAGGSSGTRGLGSGSRITVTSSSLGIVGAKFKRNNCSYLKIHYY